MSLLWDRVVELNNFHEFHVGPICDVVNNLSENNNVSWLFIMKYDNLETSRNS